MHSAAAESTAGASKVKNPSQENAIRAQLGDVLLHRTAESKNGCGWKGFLEVILARPLFKQAHTEDAAHTAAHRLQQVHSPNSLHQS